MNLGVAFHRTYARQTATVDLGASYILTAQTAQSLKLSISGPTAIILGVVSRRVLHAGGTTWVQGVHSDARRETRQSLAGRLWEAAPLLPHLTRICARLGSSLMPPAVQLQCNATPLPPGSTARDHVREKGTKPELLLSHSSRASIVWCSRQAGWWQEQVVSSGNGQQAQRQHTFDCFQVAMPVLCSDTEYVTWLGFPRDTERSWRAVRSSLCEFSVNFKPCPWGSPHSRGYVGAALKSIRVVQIFFLPSHLFLCSY